MANRRRRYSSRRRAPDIDVEAGVSVDWHGAGVRFAVVMLGVAFASVMWAMNVPEYDTLRKKEAELRQVEQREKEAMAVLDQAQTERQSLLNDVMVLEAYARDRLDYARPGETIVRIERD